MIDQLHTDPQLAYDPFERMARSRSAHGQRLTVAQTPEPNVAASDWTACVICCDPGPDDMPEWPEDPQAAHMP